VESQALGEMTAIREAYGASISRLYLGYIEEQAGDYAEAVRYLTAARDELGGMGRNAAATEALAALGRCALAQGRLEEARQSADQVWCYVQANGTGAMEMPSRAYLSVADIFDALEESAESRAAVEAGHRELIAWAERIGNVEWRRSFLENVDENRALVELWEKVQR
jgi:tetratricopeptide (TPR) repeat protein